MAGNSRCVRSDRGSATLWLLASGLLLLIAALAGAAVGSARVARHQAQVAADLAALAGAARALDGPDAACSRATVIASANGAHITMCTLDGLDLLVSVTVPVARLPGPARTAQASARAGPIRG